jgi:hypothetical protein
VQSPPLLKPKLKNSGPIIDRNDGEFRPDLKLEEKSQTLTPKADETASNPCRSP